MRTGTRAIAFKALSIGAMIAMSSQSAAAQAAGEKCELHVWPSNQIGAVFHGASATYNGLNLYLSPMQQVTQRLAEAIGPEAQNRVVTSLDLGASARFKDYRIVLHDAPTVSPFLNWLDKKVGEGARVIETGSTCYAELHVIFITLYRTSISKKIQTQFLFRDFGSTPSAAFWYVGGDSTGAPGFDSNGEEKSEAAMESVRQAFTTNLRAFLGKKKMRPRI